MNDMNDNFLPPVPPVSPASPQALPPLPPPVPVAYPGPSPLPSPLSQPLPQTFPTSFVPPPPASPPSLPSMPATAAGLFDPVTGEPLPYDPVSGQPLSAPVDFNAAGGGAAGELLAPEDLKPPSAFQRFWRRFGGEGFIISAGLHAVLLILALIWIVQRFVIAPDADKFPTGAGGGNNGATVSMNEHRVKPKNARSQVRSPNKLLVKGA
ncbi:MAG: hypothetical protein LBR07_08925, partial [Puniceicoccales bacterium]|nr:hypothetical protein [Puniceicoccales bacterium]